MHEKIVLGQKLIITGKWEKLRQQIIVSETEWPQQEPFQRDTLKAVYPLVYSITQKWLRKMIKQSLTQYGTMIEENLPGELLEKYHFVSRRQAIEMIHLPNDAGEIAQARDRLIYEEMFFFQLKVLAFRALSRSKAEGVAHPLDKPGLRAFVRALPFRLTQSQKMAIADIIHDLEQPYGMNRLLQGDVGSGKTIVAAAALFAVVRAGSQGALMAPTEILAEQHYQTLLRLFADEPIRIGLLTGSIADYQRKQINESLYAGQIDIVVGTHTLIQDDLLFHRLGLVIIDEQHRFGVQQRSVLRRKGFRPDVLTMTATPIPRTLAITAYGDMDVSTLHELPKGRKPIRTYEVKHSMLERVLSFIGREVHAGRQAYLICPLIAESETLDAQNATDLYMHIQQLFPDLHIGLLHGKLPASEKDQVMRDFIANRIEVLVSTTVIEVGVDVPNATLMIIYDADRFGLSQLHQLRGRVGRGEHASYCILVAEPKNETGRERLKVMTETHDGFEIARRDLELRGPGDYFGTKQSGMPEFRLADLLIHFDILEKSRDDVAALLARRDFWTASACLPLHEYLRREQIFTKELLD